MAKLSRDLSPGTLHPRENISGSGALGALNAEIVINADGASTVSLDLRGTFNMTVEVAGSVDGTNWTLLAVRSISGGTYLAAVTGTAAGAWVAACAGFARIRARVTAYTSGAATATLLAATGLLDDRLLGEVSSNAATITAVVSTAATLTLTAPGAGLRHYITGLRIERHAAALLTAGTTPVVLSRPQVGFTPIRLLKEAGTRPDPAVSVPRENAANPRATATAEPELDPPGM